ncbi:MAG: hypothetical protein QM796_18720 [Chthoniobacteraceae bacterium]
MNPLSVRNEPTAPLRPRVQGFRRTVLEAWQLHGPCTTRELASRSGLELLTLRPRTTELLQLGLLACLPGTGCERAYRALGTLESSQAA